MADQRRSSLRLRLDMGPTSAASLVATSFSHRGTAQLKREASRFRSRDQLPAAADPQLAVHVREVCVHCIFRQKQLPPNLCGWYDRRGRDPQRPSLEV